MGEVELSLEEGHLETLYHVSIELVVTRASRGGECIGGLKGGGGNILGGLKKKKEGGYQTGQKGKWGKVNVGKKRNPSLWRSTMGED